MAIASLLLVLATQSVTHVSALWELRQALASARPGTTVMLKSGDYQGGAMFSNLHGAPGKPIVIDAEDPAHPPRFMSGGIHFADVSYLQLRNLAVEGAAGNAVNVDDGGTYETPAHHVSLVGLRIADVPGDGSNGIKLAGVDDFLIQDCTVERWGGCAVDMVGCHRGTVFNCRFQGGGAVGVQAKGASSTVTIRNSQFLQYGQRGVNIGGSTGIPFFRPPLEKIAAGARYEAKDITVEECSFTGGVAPVAFAGADRALLRRNRILNPEHWALRILQETATPDFVPCRNGRFEDNVIVFRSNGWYEGGVNVGPGTAPKTFQFRGNTWFCSDKPERSRPTLPTQEVGGVYGRDPGLKDPF